MRLYDSGERAVSTPRVGKRRGPNDVATTMNDKYVLNRVTADLGPALNECHTKS